MEADGQVVRKGNAVTIALFVGLVAAKFVIGTVAYFAHIPTARVSARSW